MHNTRPVKISVIVRVVCAFALAFLAGAVLLMHFYFGVALQELEVPRKYSSEPVVMVSPVRGALIYYGLMFFYAVAGVACIATSFFSAWRFWRADPIQREVLLFAYRPSKTRSSVNVWRSLFLFVVVPFVVFGFLFFAVVVGKRQRLARGWTAWDPPSLSVRANECLAGFGLWLNWHWH